MIIIPNFLVEKSPPSKKQQQLEDVWVNTEKAKKNVFTNKLEGWRREKLFFQRSDQFSSEFFFSASTNIQFFDWALFFLCCKNAECFRSPIISSCEVVWCSRDDLSNDICFVVVFTSFPFPKNAKCCHLPPDFEKKTSSSEENFDHLKEIVFAWAKIIWFLCRFAKTQLIKSNPVMVRCAGLFTVRALFEA